MKNCTTVCKTHSFSLQLYRLMVTSAAVGRHFHCSVVQSLQKQDQKFDSIASVCPSVGGSKIQRNRLSFILLHLEKFGPQWQTPGPQTEAATERWAPQREQGGWANSNQLQPLRQHSDFWNGWWSRKPAPSQKFKCLQSGFHLMRNHQQAKWHTGRLSPKTRLLFR